MKYKDLIQLLVFLEVQLYILVQDTGGDVLYGGRVYGRKTYEKCLFTPNVIYLSFFF